MKLTVEINDKELQECLTEMIVKKMIFNQSTEEKVIKRKCIEEAVKKVIYSQKEDLIERCVARASAELVKKAMPKMLEKLI